MRVQVSSTFAPIVALWLCSNAGVAAYNLALHGGGALAGACVDSCSSSPAQQLPPRGLLSAPQLLDSRCGSVPSAAINRTRVTSNDFPQPLSPYQPPSSATAAPPPAQA